MENINIKIKLINKANKIQEIYFRTAVPYYERLKDDLKANHVFEMSEHNEISRQIGKYIRMKVQRKS